MCALRSFRATPYVYIPSAAAFPKDGALQSFRATPYVYIPSAAATLVCALRCFRATPYVYIPAAAALCMYPLSGRYPSVCRAMF